MTPAAPPQGAGTVTTPAGPTGPRRADHHQGTGEGPGARVESLEPCADTTNRRPVAGRRLCDMTKCGAEALPGDLAGLAVRAVAAAVGAVLLQLKPIRVVAPVLPRDVVAVLALLAGQRDLRPNVGGSHLGVPFYVRDMDTPVPRPVDLGVGSSGGRT